MTDEIRSLLELALRLEHHHLEQRDHVLIRRELRDRDGPTRYPEPLRRNETLTGPNKRSEVSTCGGSR
jgi:hypothetical protein